ncbi:2OG-Fe(II) oxygenase [Kitasatospora sp. NBC_01266]|uniref:2OG-Fe(II) oxygenase n=1 Tax=Kitasatospora sp. NBC_01266 TaxID=2903572 RepID=UPI002E353BD7|nr:2OG-Fe(II) oxygenase [Kitasatospora sp. NBC_01266]
MTVLDLAALEAAELHTDPYPHAVVEHSFGSDALARGLREEFAAAGFVRNERQYAEAGGKRYLMYNRYVVKDGKPVPESLASLSETWQQLITEILGDPYRAALGALTGVDLDGCALEARLDRYTQGCWIEPHTDRPDKVVTQLFYFNEPWREEWQGEFRVLRGPDLDDCARKVLPRLGTSVVMRRSDRSWHGVPPIVEGTGQDRLSLLVHFVRDAG